MSQSEISKAPGYVLLLATERQVHAFDLSESSRATIGRHESNDLQLVSRTVSNYHAEIVLDDEGLLMRDLDSTNGSHLNGKKVAEHRLKNGDRIRIGNHQMTVHLERLDDQKQGFFRYRRNPESFAVGTKGKIISTRATSPRAKKTLQVDNPHDLSLADLLKILTTNAKSVVLELWKGEEKGRVYIQKDKIIHAKYRGAEGEKALCRFFGWQDAEYEIVEFSNSSEVNRTINLPADTLILEGMSQMSELARLISELPPLEVPLALKEDCTLPVSAHSAAEIEIYMSIIRHRTIAAVLEETPMTDCRALRLIRALIKKGVFALSNTSDYLPEDTFVFRPQIPTEPV
jgi:sulfur carrier protein ThiS